MDDTQQWPAMVSLLKARRRSLHATITPAFGLSLLLFILVSSLTYRSTNRLLASGREVSRAQEALTNLASAATFFERAESECREYLSSGEKLRYNRMHSSIDQATLDLQSLDNLVLDVQLRQHTLNQLAAAVSDETDRLEQQASHRHDPRVLGPRLPTTGPRHVDPLSRIRDLFEQMRAEESLTLRQQTARCELDLRNRNWAFVSMVASVLLALALSYALVIEFEAHVRRGERELQNAKKAAESANQFKTIFLASMSHEIRTPLTGIMGYSDLLARPNLTDQEREKYLDIVRRSGSHLLEIVNDILDLSKIEAGRMEIERLACSPVQTVADVISLLQPKASEKSIALDSHYIGVCPETIVTDPTRLRQALNNLVANAIRFTDRGGAIRICVETVMNPGGKGRLQFRVTDSGLGMSAEEVKRLFQAFVQSDASITRRFGGTGLGLMISKQIAQALGGDIAVASQPGSGSAFTLEVDAGSLDAVRLLERPAEIVAVARNVEPAAMPRFSGRILLAEDGLTNQELIGLYLREAGAEVALAENGRIACELVTAAAKKGAPFHLVMMDMEMPEMDGCEATRQLRNQGFRLPIIALTANAMTADRDHCLTAGCNAFVTKPIDWPKLLDVVAGFLQYKDEPSNRNQDPHLARVLKTFKIELESSAESLQAAMAANDRARLSQIAHSVKGTAANCGFGDIAKAAAELEQIAKETGSSETVNRAGKALLDLCSGMRMPRAA